MRALHSIDKLAYGVLFAGAMDSVVKGMAATKATKPFADKKSQNGMKLYYGIIAVASVYKFLRIVGPKTKEEKRLIKAAEMYDKAITYQKRASIYRRAAKAFLDRRRKGFKATTSS